MVALALDLTIRAGTAGRRSLDDVMRLLWRRYRDAGDEYAGVEEDGILAAVEEASGLALERSLREWTEGTRDPDFARLLSPFGVQFDQRPAVDKPHFAMLGCKVAGEGRIEHVYDGSAAQAAGLSGGDTLVALDDLRANANNIDRLLTRYRPGDVVTLHVFRRDELLRFEVKLSSTPPKRVQLRVEPGAAAARMRRRWLESA